MNRRPRIYCFGCSFTEGVEANNFISWVDFLAKLLPDYDFFNYGVGGTSELFHAYLLRTLPEKQDSDISIFQITSHSRMTWWNQIDFHKLMHHNKDNIYKLNRDIVFQNFDRVNIGVLSQPRDKNYKFAKTYYKKMTKIYHSENYRANIRYASDFFDYAFNHRKCTAFNYDSFHDSITGNEWKKYIIDEGDHFDEIGCEQEANWVFENLKKRNIIK